MVSLAAQQRLQQPDNRLDALDLQTGRHDTAIEELQQHFEQENKYLQALQHQECLGRAAYTMAELAEAFVFDGKSTEVLLPLSLKKLFAKSDTDQLDEVQKGRCMQLQRWLNTQMPLRAVIDTDRYLRKEMPTYMPHDYANVHVRTLLKLAEAYVEPRAVLFVRSYIRLLNKLSSRDLPLSPDRTLAQMCIPCD